MAQLLEIASDDSSRFCCTKRGGKFREQEFVIEQT